MTDKEKLIKIKSLADKMYNAAFNMTTDASLLRKAMDDYHQFIIYKYHKEEPVNKDFEMTLAEMIDKAQKCVVEPLVVAAQWKDELIKLAKCEEPVSEDLEKASKEWLAPQLDKSYANYGEAKMMELTHFDGYAMLDAIEFGAQWKEEQLAHCDAQTEEEAEVERDFVTGIIKKEHRLPTFDDAIKYGYNQAQKDLGLTWEDIEQIYFLVMVEANKLNKYKHDVKEMYQEVLKRFKEKKL